MAVHLPGRPIARLRAAASQDGDNPALAGMPPDWLETGAAGAGLGWIFGPVGGLIGAGIAHVINKRQRRGIVAAAAQDRETADALTESINGALGIASEQAVTDQDNAELAVLEQKKAGLEALMRHYDPAMRELGIQGMLNLADQVGADLDEIEAAGLARAADERAREALEFDRLMAISDDLVRDSGQYIKGREAWRRLMAVEPTEAGDLALIFNFMKVLDPDSTVREGEAASVQNAAGVPDAVLTLYNRLLKGGERLDPIRRQDIRRQAGLAYAELRSAQIDRNALALERGRDGGLSEELLDTLQVPIDPNELSLIPAPVNEGGSAEARPVRGSSPVLEEIRQQIEADTGVAPREPDSRTFGEQLRDAGGALADNFQQTFGSATGYPLERIMLFDYFPQTVRDKLEQLPAGVNVRYNGWTGNLTIRGPGTFEGISGEVELTDAERAAIIPLLPTSREEEQRLYQRLRRESRRGVIVRPTN